jgi:hypothetical protein
MDKDPKDRIINAIDELDRYNKACQIVGLSDSVGCAPIVHALHELRMALAIMADIEAQQPPPDRSEGMKNA